MHIFTGYSGEGFGVEVLMFAILSPNFDGVCVSFASIRQSVLLPLNLPMLCIQWHSESPGL